MWNDTDAAARERLSAMLDGELEPVGVKTTCVEWTASVETRTAWHAYHLIGDVLRSDDLACHPQRDADFLARLRGRLAEEPVVLAPAAFDDAARVVDPLSVGLSTVAPPRRRLAWKAGSAMAAGFVAVAGLFVVTRPGGSPEQITAGATRIAPLATSVAPSGRQAQPAYAAFDPVQAPAPQARPDDTVLPEASGQMIRDARLDRYLAAHQQFGSAFGGPSGYLRNAAVELPGR